MTDKKIKAARGSILMVVAVVLVCLLVGAAVGLTLGAAKSVNNLDPTKLEFAQSSLIYDVNGNLIHKLHAEEDRSIIRYNAIPTDMKNAIVAVEDKDFYDHPGISLKRIIGAVVVDIKTMSKSQGASTITQQLARNVYLSLDKKWTRKIKEVIIALQIERKYTKNEILEMYLNRIPFGHGTYGIETASQFYFGHSAKTLSLAESAMLAGLPKAPNGYSPYLHPDKAKERQELVLDLMAEQGYISDVQAAEAKAEPVKLIGMDAKRNGAKTHISTEAPYFVEYVRQYLIDEYGADAVYRGGLKVYTTLDLDMQKKAEETLMKNLPDGYTDENGVIQPQAALVTLDAKSGEIRAMIGGRDFESTELNRSVQAWRQPGSAFKPFVYTSALEQGYTAATVVDDSPVSYGGYTPHNTNRGYQGPITIRKALAQSVNVVAVKTLDQTGISNTLDLAKQMGISKITSADENLAVALGGMNTGTTPLEMAAAYAVYPNGGVWVEPYGIIRVEDKKGNILEEHKVKKRDVISPQIAFIMARMMEGVINGGTGSRANIGRPAAGKTGTTSDYNDAWFVGYTPDLVTSVWIGCDRKSAQSTAFMKGRKISSSYPARIFGAYMRQAVAGMPVSNFSRPGGIVGPLQICSITGDLATSACAGHTFSEYFIKGTEPTSHAVGHETVTICKDSGKLATPQCPNTETRVIYGDSAPTEYCPLHTAPPDNNTPPDWVNTGDGGDMDTEPGGGTTTPPDDGGTTPTGGGGTITPTP